MPATGTRQQQLLNAPSRHLLFSSSATTSPFQTIAQSFFPLRLCMAQHGTYPLGTSFGPLVIDCNGPLRDRPPVPHASYTQRTSSMTPSRSIVVEMKGQRFERHDETKRTPPPQVSAILLRKSYVQNCFPRLSHARHSSVKLRRGHGVRQTTKFPSRHSSRLSC